MINSIVLICMYGANNVDDSKSNTVKPIETQPSSIQYAVLSRRQFDFLTLGCPKKPIGEHIVRPLVPAFTATKLLHFMANHAINPGLPFRINRMANLKNGVKEMKESQCHCKEKAFALNESVCNTGK